MAAELVVAPEAELDITEAYVWYESRRAGLGEEFLSAVDASMERIRRQPAIYARQSAADQSDEAGSRHQLP
jgi:hypothetical protein